MKSLHNKIISIAADTSAKLRMNAAGIDNGTIDFEENAKILRESKLNGMLIPVKYGGMGATCTEMAEAASVLAAGCLSSSLVWSMHCQQVATLVDHAPQSFLDSYMPEIVRHNFLIGSVTTEENKGGHLLSALAPLSVESEAIVIDRYAPIVSGGLSCDAYLITMKAGSDSDSSDVKLVYAEKKQLDIQQVRAWKVMGMRGTNSIALKLHGKIKAEQVINNASPFKDIAVATMIPVGHIAWASSWYGAAKEAVRLMIAHFRDPVGRGRFNLSSDLFLEKLARIRLELDTVGTYLNRVIKLYMELKPSIEKLHSPAFQIKINNLKVLSSERLFKMMDDLVQLSGIRQGYYCDEDIPLERIFRDIRSASLMYHNDRLLTANGKLCLFDRGPDLLESF